MTPMCLVEAILAKEVRITDFSLIILDECHNTQGDHPYKKLMNIYMDSKFTNDRRDVACLPQVRCMFSIRYFEKCLIHSDFYLLARF